MAGWTDSIGSDIWIRKAVLLELQCENGGDPDVCDISTINAVADPTGADVPLENTLDIDFTPTNGGAASITLIPDTVGAPDPNPRGFKVWDITDVEASAATVEQGQQITVSWVLDVGALTEPEFVVADARNDEQGTGVETFVNGVAKEVYDGFPVDVYNLGIQYEVVDSGMATPDIVYVAETLFTVLPAHPTDLAVTLDGTDAVLTWTDNSGTTPQVALEYADNPSFSGATPFEEGVFSSDEGWSIVEEDFSVGTWYFRIKATENSLSSGWSNTAQLTESGGGGGGNANKTSLGLSLGL